MAKKSGSKTKLIHEYLNQNPTATWKTAKNSLEKHGINANYFSLQKGKWKKAKEEAANGASSSKRVATARKTAAPSTAAAGRHLSEAADFAREVGGIDKAKRLLEQLSAMQV